MDNQEPGPLGAAWLWLAGLGGAVVSLAHQGDLSWPKRLATVASGALLAGFCGPWVADYLGASPRGSAALHFLMGLAGFYVSGGLFKLAQAVRDDPAAALGEVLKRLGGKLTGG